MLKSVPVCLPGYCVVAAPGPSLETLCAYIDGLPVVAVQDAYRLVPWADVLYGCDEAWWHAHYGAMDFKGQRWSSHTNRETNDKTACYEAYGLNVVYGTHDQGFSTDPKKIHYGSNSGFQSINLAILMGAKRIGLVGFDWQKVGGKTHFFGEHPKGLFSPNFHSFEPEMAYAARHLPDGIEVVNFTPGSALKCFPMRPIDELRDFLKRDASDDLSACA